MKAINTYRFRKVSDINMDYPYFEVVDNLGETIFDISRTEDDELRILFYDGVASKHMPVEMLLKIVEDAKKLLFEQ